jgi:uncharacterized protein YggE
MLNNASGRRLVALSLVTLAVVSPLSADAEGRGAEPRTLDAVGRATVRAAPDTLRIVVAVETQAKTAAEAAKANALVSARVVSALEQGVSRDGEVSTSGYSLRARYEYRKAEQRQELVGYIATNSVAVTSSSLDRAGELIDGAVAAGANSVASIDFLLRDREDVERQAVLEAGRRARARVEAIAESLGVGVGRLLRATTEIGAIPLPHPQLARGMMMAESADAGTPISAGDIAVEMAVHVVFEVP